MYDRVLGESPILMPILVAEYVSTACLFCFAYRPDAGWWLAIYICYLLLVVVTTRVRTYQPIEWALILQHGRVWTTPFSIPNQHQEYDHVGFIQTQKWKMFWLTRFAYLHQQMYIFTQREGIWVCPQWCIIRHPDGLLNGGRQRCVLSTLYPDPSRLWLSFTNCRVCSTSSYDTNEYMALLM